MTEGTLCQSDENKNTGSPMAEVLHPNKKLVKNSCAALPTALYYIYESIRIR